MMKGIIILLLIIVLAACSSETMKRKQTFPEQKTIVNSNTDGKGPEISIEFYKGKSFYYPLMALWIEDESGTYIQSLFVAKSVASGIFKFGKQENGKWVSGPKRAPQTLPYWAHKRGVIASDGLFMPDPENPLADAYSGETPVKSFIINTRADKDLPAVFRILFEINQNWDWNEFWTNDKYSDDENYKMSCQPALIYEAVIDTRSPEKSYKMKAIGHSHYSGKSGELFPDMSTLTTALQIADSILVRIE